MGAFDKKPLVFYMGADKKEADKIKELKRAYEERMKEEGAIPCRHSSVEYHFERGYVLCKLCGRVFEMDEYQKVKKKINEELGRL